MSSSLSALFRRVLHRQRHHAGQQFPFALYRTLEIDRRLLDAYAALTAILARLKTAPMSLDGSS